MARCRVMRVSHSPCHVQGRTVGSQICNRSFPTPSDPTPSRNKAAGRTRAFVACPLSPPPAFYLLDICVQGHAGGRTDHGPRHQRVGRAMEPGSLRCLVHRVIAAHSGSQPALARARKNHSFYYQQGQPRNVWHILCTTYHSLIDIRRPSRSIKTGPATPGFLWRPLTLRPSRTQKDSSCTPRVPWSAATI